MSVHTYRLKREHSCDLPRPKDYTDGDLARCGECGRWWIRVWDFSSVRGVWAPCSRRRARRLRRKLGEADA